MSVLGSYTLNVAPLGVKFRTESLSSVLFCSLAVLDPRVGHTMDVLSPFISILSILIDSSTESPVHDLMLSI